jgi:uncharacterized membrane protein YjjP (DUF1212 family)
VLLSGDQTKPEPEKKSFDDLPEFMFRLGQAFLASGEQTAKVELILRRAASAYGVRGSRVVAFPTALFISLHEGAEEKLTLAEGPTQTLRLDQIADVYKLGESAERGEVAPREGLQRLNEIMKTKPRFGLVGNVFGHCILSMGVSMVLMSTYYNLAAAAVLGAVVGIVKAFNRNRAVLAVPLAVVAAAIVSALTYLAVKYELPVDPLHTLVPPLVTFLPGAMLTLGMVELAYGDMVSGSSRLVTGFVQLVLLVFGLAAGAILVGYNPEDLVDAAEITITLPWAAWVPWIGVIVFGTGVYLHFSAPKKSLLWILLVILSAFAAQQTSAGFFGKVASGFFGMLVATPLAYLIQLKFKGPPAVVTFLPSFWLLVPGALGLISVKHILSDRQAGMEGLMTTVFVFASIALGTLMGASLYKGLTEQFGWWQLQIGRAGRSFRDKSK